MSGAIGFFDSGVGGITVLQAARVLLPHESFIYVADSKYAPYGELSPERIQERSLMIADFLVSQNVKAIVCACNTATSHAAALLRSHYEIPIIGMEPGIKPAVLASQTKKVGVLATPVTLQGEKYQQLAQKLSNESDTQVEIFARPCPGLVDEIENGNIDSASIINLLKEFVNPLLDEGVDQLVLGCTHYPLLKPIIQNIVGNKVQIVETSTAVAKHLQENITLSSQGEANTVYYSSAPDGQAEVFKKLFNITDNIRTLPV